MESILLWIKSYSLERTFDKNWPWWIQKDTPISFGDGNWTKVIWTKWIKFQPKGCITKLSQKSKVNRPCNDTKKKLLNDVEKITSYFKLNLSRESFWKIGYDRFQQKISHFSKWNCDFLLLIPKRRFRPLDPSSKDLAIAWHSVKFYPFCFIFLNFFGLLINFPKRPRQRRKLMWIVFCKVRFFCSITSLH